MDYVNYHLKNIRPYTLPSHQVWKLSPSEREGVLKLDWNEATVDPSPKVMERLSRLLAQGHFLNLYPETRNHRIIELLSKYTGLEEAYLDYFPSSDILEEYLVKTYLIPGDKVLLIWPSYDNFRLTAQTAGAQLLYYQLGEDFIFSPEKYEQMLYKETPRFAYICNPNNPTGLQLETSYIEYLLQSFPRTMFLVDEAYWEFSGITAQHLVRKYKNLLISRTLSKAFALANIRFGYLLSSKENIQWVSRVKNPKNVTSFAQEAVIGALEDVSYMREYVEEVRKARAYFIQAVNGLPGDLFHAYPSSGNFVLIRCKNFDIKIALLSWLQNEHIFVRDTQQSESLKECVRVSIGLLSQMEKVSYSFLNYCETK